MPYHFNFYLKCTAHLKWLGTIGLNRHYLPLFVDFDEYMKKLIYHSLSTGLIRPMEWPHLDDPAYSRVRVSCQQLHFENAVAPGKQNILTPFSSFGYLRKVGGLSCFRFLVFLYWNLKFGSKKAGERNIAVVILYWLQAPRETGPTLC